MLIAPISKVEPTKRTFNNQNHQQEKPQLKSKSWDAIFEEGNSDLTRKAVKGSLSDRDFSIDDEGVGNLEDFLRSKSRMIQVTTTPSSLKKNAYMEKAKRRTASSFDISV